MNIALEADQLTITGFFGWTHHAVDFLGFQIIEEPPRWLHIVLHLVLVIAPLATLLAIILLAAHTIRKVVQRKLMSAADRAEYRLVRSLLSLRWQDQAVVVALGLAAQPILYATLELPKRIVNGAIESNHFPVVLYGSEYSQLQLLGLLSLMYLATLVLGGLVKYLINIKKGEIGERTLLRLRVRVYRAWLREPLRKRKTEVIPLSTSEIEPIGGFAGSVLATPVFQGGTLITVLLFMFVQDPILGAAAMTLVPVQLFIIPLLQRWVNQRMWLRIHAVRSFGDILGAQTQDSLDRRIIRKTLAATHALRLTRLSLQRAKYLQKAISNFLMSLTPLLLYSIGGWLVIEGRLSLGALIAVIASFKDFSGPFRELILYYQSFSDVRLRAMEYQKFLLKFGTYKIQISAARRSVAHQASNIRVAN